MGADFHIRGDTKLDSSGFSKGIDKLGSVAKAGMGVLVKAGAAAVGALGAAGVASVKLASDLTEVQNVVDVTFGKNADTINDWAKNAASAFGLSELQAKKFNGTMGAMLKSMGLSDDAVLDMSTSMTGLAGDFASFYNLPIEEAFQKIRSGISGETEPLKELGINMSVANLEAYALSQGIDKSYNSMTQAEQAALRYNYLMSVSADAQGDFARTNDTLANQLRIAQLEVQNLSGAIGMSLLPMAQEMLGVGIDMLGQLKQGFEQGGVEGLISAATNVVGQLLNGFVNSAPSLIDAGVQILMMVLNGIATLIPTLPQQSQTIITALANGIFTLLPTLLILGGQVLASLIDGFLRSLPDLIDMGWQFIETLAEGIEEAIPGLDGILTGLLDAFKALLPVIAGVAGAIVGFKAAMAISTVIDTVKNALTGFSLANQLAAASQAALNFVMNLNPFVLIATLIAGAVAALVVLWNTNEDFRNAVITIWEAIKQAFSVAWEWIVGVWNQFQPYFQMAWDFLVSVFSQVVQTVSEPFAAAWQLIVTVWNLALPYFQAFWDFLVGIFTPIAEILGNFFSAAWEWIVGVWNAAQPYFQAIWSGIQTVFSVVSEVLGLYFRTAWNVIQLIWNAVTGYFQNIFNTISNIFSFIEALFRGDFQAAWDAIVDIFTGWGEYFQGLFDKIGEIFSDIWDTFKKIGSDAIEALKDGINAAWDGLVSWFNGLWDGLFGNKTANVTVNKTVNETVTRSGRSVNGSHRSGLDYVPFDGYIAELHKGEMVLTSQQAGLWRNGIAQRMLSAASSVMLANQSRSPVLATAGAPAVHRQTAATVQTQHTTVIEMDGRTVAKVITPFVDQFLF
ncbi:MAG TPA: hypothetical protein H9698_10565 [Candidatus Ruthenibacterium merdavium]|uniref:Uncharacterized protein n=1 Tax=Candidatus Ruthenibacterium merdavium TaxID=2838752 RepID=A0A9D2Q6B8_9FIRM|nr:hypothetical protein [Candidatus Ruthenibacterium merdavium]